ncbi:CoA-substrate-specific enzyme activase, putative [Desulfatibacillum alkenivorans DSM 16219]|jgi:predicted CoA-substrate-specific enzyme activase|uniref:CoA-substrate-specific enzyme activase, putative n=1 Tax=Desulfatibacillum alkenivorans DSM 16219 TaxID=1121393 RepID=A0A1M6DM59_9BACT|nr:acyl-CoA dehydratase activase [Desulfatibacillum alkenivorans]SHI74078.1 CoA-substrate-specific enzyme activase, putative [Desulfatibacillum alkenivorans DSM 16219]
MAKYYGGCDLGSTTGKAVILKDGEIVATACIRSKIDPVETGREVLNLAIQQIDDLERVEDLAKLVGTGYGRNEVPFADENVSEITCHAVGAHFCDNNIRTIVDVGGQDIKAIALSDTGSVLEFAMNDKCAAGTGRFYEAVVRTFDLSLDEFSELSLKAKKIVPVTSQCTVFAESELVSLLYKRNSPADIAAGVQLSVAKRVFTLARRVGVKPGVTVTGGCSKNIGLVKALEKTLRTPISLLSTDPQLTGALGAAVLASRNGSG